MTDYRVVRHPAGGWDVRSENDQHYREHFMYRSSAIDAARPKVARSGGGTVQIVDRNGHLERLAIEADPDASSTPGA